MLGLQKQGGLVRAGFKQDACLGCGQMCCAGHLVSLKIVVQSIPRMRQHQRDLHVGNHLLDWDIARMACARGQTESRIAWGSHMDVR